MDEVTLLQWRGFEQQAMEIKQAIAGHQQAMQGGDKRTGLFNARSRQAKIDELLQQLAKVEMQKRLLTQTPNGSMAAPESGAAALPGATPAAPVTAAAASGEINPDEFFGGL